MSAIDVTKAHPKRLLFSQGQWCLEVTRWHAIDRDIFNPISSYIPGPDAAISYLEELVFDHQLIEQARDILRREPISGVAYELEEKRWVLQTQFAERPLAEEPPAMTPSSDAQELLHRLREMDDRLKHIEKKIAGHVLGNDVTPSVRPVPNGEDAQSHAG